MNPLTKSEARKVLKYLNTGRKISDTLWNRAIESWRSTPGFNFMHDYLEKIIEERS